MICDRCGEITETFVTEQHGELCEACQRLVEEQDQQQRAPDRQTASSQEG